MDLRLDGKTALVTGASSGLGARFAEALAASGARVALAARRTDRLDALKAKIEAAGGSAYSIALDVTRVADVEPAIDRIEREFGALDILVNNSGVTVTQRLTDVTEADYDYIADTNQKGAFFVAQAAGKRMMARGRGRIINIASLAAVKALSRIGVYAMSKAAVVQMTRMMALEWARSGVCVNALLPGYIETELNEDWWASEGGKKLVAMMPRRRVGRPDDLDGIIVYLASDASDFMNGSIINVDDGFGVA